jgi:probable addiction module antidote protein
LASWVIAELSAGESASCGSISGLAIDFTSARRAGVSFCYGVERSERRPATLSKQQPIGEILGTDTKMPRSVSYHDYLIRSLKDPKQAEGYLNAALEDGDARIFLIALRNVAEAQGGMGKAAAKSKLNRESLYRMLSKKGNPGLQSLAALLSSLGFRLAVESKDAA